MCLGSGYASKKAYKGGKARIDPETVRKLAAEGVKPAHIARQLGISRGTVYRFLPEATSNLPITNEEA